MSLATQNVFGRTSRAQLATAEYALQKVAHRVLLLKDHSIIKGHRSEDQQNAAFERGASQLRWPNGRHNDYPSRALDVQVYPRPADPQTLQDRKSVV